MLPFTAPIREWIISLIVEAINRAEIHVNITAGPR